MFYLWRRMEEEDRGRVWRLYGWFTALMACGSCFGVVAWTASMFHRARLFEAEYAETVVENRLLYSLGYRWRAAFLVTYAIEFLCLSAALLMVLDRMSVFAAPQGAQPQQRWALAGRVVMATVILGNAHCFPCRGCETVDLITTLIEQFPPLCVGQLRRKAC